MPSNVLLLSGYWPAVGFAAAVVTREGQVALVVPEDEEDLAEKSWADEVITYCPDPLDRIVSTEESVLEALVRVKHVLRCSADRIGFELTDAFEPAAYAPDLLRASAVRLLRRLFPSATLAPADELLAELRTIKTAAEREHIRTACRIAERAFLTGAKLLRSGITETEAASGFRVSLNKCLGDFGSVHRCDGFVQCMSGPNSAKAFGPYGRSRPRRIEDGDLVVVRCHSYADGYWADLARTYYIGAANERIGRMFEAVLQANAAAVNAIAAGVSGAALYYAARDVLRAYGFEQAFKHSAGYGAGFGATDHAARPRLHPKSDDAIVPGMVLKLETGAYVDDFGGIRHAEMVAVTEHGPEMLSVFHSALPELALQP